ncbi:MAG TPA: fused MFS/spermidine synthase [Gemmataceae bacterium]|nr:fused MFS/spermidine synthase [Gemmataceae bacterium]
MNSKTTQASLKRSGAKAQDAARSPWLPALFAGTLFLSSALLFLVQPMFAKMVLPLLGGTPAVWNTCMVFFQAALLGGYAYAHVAPDRLGVRRHAILHLFVLLVPFLVLPISVAHAASPPGEASPIPWLLGVLAVTVGLPFFVVSTSGPLLQRWFAQTGYPSAKDPYFLYSASNLGSMLALLSYPLLLEPSSFLKTQSLLWTGLYGVLMVLVFACAWVLLRIPAPAADPGHDVATDPRPRSVDHGIQSRQRVKWVALAFVPSSLMLSVTTYLTTDLAAIPLLWVIPLAIYLLTFTLVFARRPLFSQALIVRILPFAVLALTFAMLSQATKPLWFLLALHLVTFFLIAMVCHGELARQRPPAEHLTEYYLWLSVGGVLGGLFNALVAPLVFNSVMEYPLVIMLACCLMPAARPREEKQATGQSKKERRKQRFQAATIRAEDPPDSPQPWLAVAALEACLFLLPGALAAGLGFVLRRINYEDTTLENTAFGLSLIFGLPMLLCYAFNQNRVRFGLAIGFLLFAGATYQGVNGETLYRARSFFGIHRVALAPSRDFYQLVNGSTVHGSQRIDQSERAEPFTYYHESSPIGQVFHAFSGPAAKPQVAIVGLGVGSLAYYGARGQEFTFYEIDPTVLHIARDLGYFTFLRDCRAKVDYVLGDARLTVQHAPDNHFGILIIDAFSSDAIPLHLLTREAVAIYKKKLASDGILAFHISNSYLDLAPVLAQLAKDARLLCWSQSHIPVGKGPVWESQWLIMAHRKEDLGNLLERGPWQPMNAPPGTPTWTDDFSNIFSVLHWR